jgi:hypothetical protein
MRSSSDIGPEGAAGATLAGFGVSPDAGVVCELEGVPSARVTVGAGFFAAFCAGLVAGWVSTGVEGRGRSSSDPVAGAPAEAGVGAGSGATSGVPSRVGAAVAVDAAAATTNGTRWICAGTKVATSIPSVAVESHVTNTPNHIAARAAGVAAIRGSGKI